MAYKIELKRSYEDGVSVSYNGQKLQGVTGIKLESTDEGPALVLTLKPDLVEVESGFNHPPRSQSL